MRLEPLLELSYFTRALDLDEGRDRPLQKSYKEHLEQLRLLRERYHVDPKTKRPRYESSGKIKISGYEITQLGRLLLRQVGLSQVRSADEKGKVRGSLSDHSDSYPTSRPATL